MSVCKAYTKDADAILFVINKSNSEAYRKIIPVEYFKEPVLTLEELLEDFKRMTFYVYKLEGRIVAVSALEIENETTGKLRWVYVLPKYQRKGIGTSLINYIERESGNMGLKKLRVPAIEAHWTTNFYIKLGYKIVDRTWKLWGNHIVLEKMPSN